MRHVRLLLAVLFSASLLLIPSAWAQENATITGAVSDPTGAVIPNVAITLTNTATGQARETASNNSGIYVFSNVGVGHFNLDVTAPGFQKFSRTDIDVNTGQTLKEDVNLTVGNAAQTVTVQAECPAGPIGNQRAQHPDHRPAGHPTGDQRQKCDRPCIPGSGSIRQFARL